MLNRIGGDGRGTALTLANWRRHLTMPAMHLLKVTGRRTLLGVPSSRSLRRDRRAGRERDTLECARALR